MKNLTSIFRKTPIILIVLSLLQNLNSSAQCINADFSAGSFTGWQCTWGQCANNSLLGGTNTCIPNTGWAFLNNALKQGANNAATNVPENHFIMTSGFDAVVGGSSIPVVFDLRRRCRRPLAEDQACGNL